MNYEKLSLNYYQNNPNNPLAQIKLLNKIKDELLSDNQKLSFKILTPPTKADYEFFSSNYEKLTPVFIEKYNDRQDVYCLDIEDTLVHKISVFSEDGIVHTWNSIEKFIQWLKEDSGYLEEQPI